LCLGSGLGFVLNRVGIGMGVGALIGFALYSFLSSRNGHGT
jgi:hypothetical protein